MADNVADDPKLAPVWEVEQTSQSALVSVARSQSSALAHDEVRTIGELGTRFGQTAHQPGIST